MIAWKTWLELRWLMLTYAVIMELLLIPAILLWPAIRDEANLLSSLGRIIPIQSFQHMFDAMSNTDSDTAYRAYMSVQMFFKGVNVVGICGAVLLATGMISRERESQSLEFLLARPVARWRILLEKFAVIAVGLIVPIFLTSWSAIPLSGFVEEELPFGAVTLGAFHASMFVLLFTALTCLGSVISRTQVNAAFFAGTFIIIELAMFFIQEIRVGSVFMLSDFDTYGPIMAGNRSFTDLFFGSTLWLLIGTAGLYLSATVLFRRSQL